VARRGSDNSFYRAGSFITHDPRQVDEYDMSQQPSGAGTASSAEGQQAAASVESAASASEPSSRDQARDVLLQTLAEIRPDLELHVDAVMTLAEGVAAQLALPAEEVERVRFAAQLHDIGKVAIPEAILKKPGPLDDREWSLISSHTIIGERILGAAPALAGVAELVRSSHERWDGKGYPDRLRGEQIPVGARIISVCDSFDAMTSNRAYRLAMTPRDAVAELERCAGTQFDPLVVAAFVAAMQPQLAAEGGVVRDAAPRVATS
jgi:HD-GYP domain-containing protein (c-di-GMP phosphodiesterase class II)